MSEGSTPVEVLGSLAFPGNVTVYRPAPLTPSPAALLSGYTPGVTRGGTFALGPSPSALPGLGAGAIKAGPAFSRLWAMRRSPEAYPLYEAIDALVEAVIELNKRGGGL